jgi:serine phosphatase RsbU (regulator of sigma subunit)
MRLYSGVLDRKGLFLSYLYWITTMKTITLLISLSLSAVAFSQVTSIPDPNFEQRLIYFEMGDYYNAAVNLKLHYDMRNSLLSERNERIMREKDTKYQTVKKEKELEETNRILIEKDSAIERQNIIIGASIGGGILLALLLLVVVRKNKVTKRQSAIIEEQRSIVIKRQAEIISSINYAKRIQDAILKSEEHVTEHLPEHFVIYKPKDIVSGDFYWVKEKGNYLYLAVADCTGHGVPGAFLTMLGSSFLNEIYAVERNLSPAEILDKLRLKFVKELSQSDEQGENSDGMDISLIRLNLRSKELAWAGANNPLWIRRKASQEIEIIKPDKEPIAHARVMTPFSNHEVKLEEGDSFYLFSDGYVDQFGGPKGKKFMAKALKELILSIQDKTIAEQKLVLDERFKNWKGELNQIDDVCMVGMRV